MKIFVIHDKQGNIKSTAVPQSEGVGVKPKKGHSVLQLERPDSSPAELELYLRNLSNFVVKRNAGKSELVKKSQKKEV